LGCALRTNGNGLEVFRSVPGCAVRGLIPLGSQLFKIVMQGLPGRGNMASSLDILVALSRVFSVSISGVIRWEVWLEVIAVLMVYSFHSSHQFQLLLSKFD
jgi:hypothetical protein